jgi:hypothetical protein
MGNPDPVDITEAGKDRRELSGDCCEGEIRDLGRVHRGEKSSLSTAVVTGEIISDRKAPSIDFEVNYFNQIEFP